MCEDNKYSVDIIRGSGSSWSVYSHKGKRLGGPYKTKAEAAKRLKQVEYFKAHPQK